VIGSDGDSPVAPNAGVPLTDATGGIAVVVAVLEAAEDAPDSDEPTGTPAVEAIVELAVVRLPPLHPATTASRARMPRSVLSTLNLWCLNWRVNCCCLNRCCLTPRAIIVVYRPIPGVSADRNRPCHGSRSHARPERQDIPATNADL